MSRVLINVAGADRTGTTTLGAMLGHHSTAFHVGEVHGYYRPLAPWHRSAAWLSPMRQWNNAYLAQSQAFHDHLARQMGKNIVVDSSKSVPWLIDDNDWARAAGMCVFNFATWKHPVDLAYSHWKRGTYKSWRPAFLRYYTMLLDSELPVLMVHFDQLAAHPSRVLKRLCELTGMPWEDGMERFWEEPPLHVGGSGGARHQMNEGKRKSALDLAVPTEFDDSVGSRVRESLENDTRLKRIISCLRRLDIFESAYPTQQHGGSRGGWYWPLRIRQRLQTSYIRARYGNPLALKNQL